MQHTELLTRSPGALDRLASSPHALQMSTPGVSWAKGALQQVHRMQPAAQEHAGSCPAHGTALPHAQRLLPDLESPVWHRLRGS